MSHLYEPRCSIHEKPNPETHHKGSYECGPNAQVRGSYGAEVNPLSFYSTTSSTTHIDWLPTLKSKFHLHLRTSDHPATLPLKQKSKIGTGYTKNCGIYCEYDKKIDEPEYKFLEEAYKTTNRLQFQAPPKKEIEFGKSQFLGQPVTESGFTRTPKNKVTDQGKDFHEFQTEMKSQFLQSNSVLKGHEYDKSKILSCGSAFTTDVGHIESFGVSQESPFEKPKPPVVEKEIKWPKQMKPNGFTRSFTGRLHASVENPPGVLTDDTLDKIQHSDPTRWMAMHENGHSTSRNVYVDLHPMDTTMSIHRSHMSIGPKQETGSIRNNHPFIAQDDSKSRFTTETSDQFRKTTVGPVKTACTEIPRSGFTLCNKYQFVKEIETDKDVLQRLHPSVARYRAHQMRDVYASRPTQASDPFWVNDRVAKKEALLQQ